MYVVLIATYDVIFCFTVIDVLKKYYHSFLANMVPEDVRNKIIHKCTWITFKYNIHEIPNEHFLDLLILLTENNILVLRFCTTIANYLHSDDIIPHVLRG